MDVDVQKILLNEKDFKYVISSFLSYLGPGLFTGYDFNKDGYDDIVVSADMDHEAGYAAGAIYILSGKKIFNQFFSVSFFFYLFSSSLVYIFIILIKIIKLNNIKLYLTYLIIKKIIKLLLKALKLDWH